MKFTLSLLLLTLLHSKPSVAQVPTTEPSTTQAPPTTEPLTTQAPPTTEPLTTQAPPTPPPPPPQPVPSVYYQSVYVPVGAGEPQHARTSFEPFGLFPKEFTTCGKTSLNLNKAFPKGKDHITEIMVDCEPTPTRVIIAPSLTFGDFKRDLKKECEIFSCTDKDYEAKDTDLPAIVNSESGAGVKAPEKENGNLNVCGSKKAGYLQNAPTKIVFANEGDCYAAMPAFKKNIEMTTNPATYSYQVPRWLKTTEDRKNLRNFYFSDEKSENLMRVPFIFTYQPTANPSYLPCGTTCDRGTVVKITMRSASYSSMIYVDAEKCSSFRVCYAADDFLDDKKTPTCKDDFTIDVLFKTGVIIWGKKGRSSTIEFMSQYHQVANVVPIEFGYGVKVHGKVVGNFYFGNDHREIVTSDSGGYAASDASQLAFIFPHENCLKTGAGIFSKNIETGKTLSTDADKVVSDGHKYTDQGEMIVGKPEEIATTTTKEPVHNLVYTTTPAAVRIIAEPGALSMIDESEAASSAIFATGKWWTWGVYAGFVIGTLVTLGIGGGLFYLLRRTVFSVWYRGMYKRYGCDASGTTGGITGVGFGNTTAAVETVNGITGGTTMGTTGTTGGGDTTGGTTGSTSGSSTIAM